MLAVDEKPSIQALERVQGYLKLANGRALTGQSHNYKRHGTTTLFAALDIATVVTGRQYKRRRRLEFLDFMNGIVKANQGAKSMSFLIISTPISRNATAGWPGIRTSISTLPRPALPGSIKSDQF